MQFSLPIRAKDGGLVYDLNTLSVDRAEGSSSSTVPQSSAHRFRKQLPTLDENINAKLALVREVQTAVRPKVQTITNTSGTTEPRAATVYKQSQWHSLKPVAPTRTSFFNPFRFLWGYSGVNKSFSTRLDGDIFAVRSVDLATNAALKEMKDDIPLLTSSSFSFRRALELLTLDTDDCRDLAAMYREACGREHQLPIEGAPETISWQTVLEIGKDFLELMEVYEAVHTFRLSNMDVVSDRGPSRDESHFKYRVKLWQWKKDVCQTILEYSDTKLSRKLDEEFREDTVVGRLWKQTHDGIFTPWPETPETVQKFSHAVVPEHCKVMVFPGSAINVWKYKKFYFDTTEEM